MLSYLAIKYHVHTTSIYLVNSLPAMLIRILTLHQISGLYNAFEGYVIYIVFFLWFLYIALVGSCKGLPG